MRFAVPKQDPRIRALVVGLHRDGDPAAATWRKVGDAAEDLGLRRPSYHLVRELVRLEEELREAQADVRRAALGVVAAAGSQLVVDLPIALDALREARARETLVSRRHKPLSA